MKILIPDSINGEYSSRIKGVSKEVTIDILTVKRNRSIMRRTINFMAKRLFPYYFYKKIKSYTMKNRISFYINGVPFDGGSNGIEVLLVPHELDAQVLEQLFPRLPNLKWIHSLMTGMDHIVSVCPSPRNLRLTNSGNVHSKRIAEFVLSIILATSKRIPEHLFLQRKRKWQSLASRELYRSTVGIIGLGNIGSELAKRAKALGMKVVAMDIESKINKDIDLLVNPQQINILLSQSDFVVLCCPLTKETKGMIGEKQLKCMKKNAYLINVARGALIQDHALLRALKERRIQGACLDVLVEQPLPSHSPFYKMDNVIITHHSAFYSKEAVSEKFCVFLENLVHYIKGEQLINEIDKDRGF